MRQHRHPDHASARGGDRRRDRIVVFGKSARLLADIDVARWDKRDFAVLREAIQATLQNNEQDLRLIRA
jgi:NitT/TauT family transport system ATP-binding protein